MAAAYDTAVAGQSNGTNSIALTLTTAGANEALLVYTHVSNTATISSVTLSGQTFVKDGATLSLGGNGQMERWRCLCSSSQSSATVTVTTTGNPQMTAVLIAVSGVDTTGTNGSGFMGNVSDAQGSGTAATSSVTTAANGSLVIAGVGATNASTYTAGTAQTNRATSAISAGFSSIAGLTQNATTTSSGTSVTMNATDSSAGNWGVMATELKASAGGGVTVTSTLMLMGAGS